MKRRIFTILMCLMMLFSLSSCETYTYATTQDDIYVEAEVDVVRSNVSFDVIIQYGTPYYRDGVLLYYLYRDIYYYPFYYNNYWYVRAYRRPFTHFDTRPYFRPHKYDYRFSPGHYRGFDRPDGPTRNYRRPAPEPQRQPNIRYNDRPGFGAPDTRPRRVEPQRQSPQVNQSRPQRSQARPDARPAQPRIDRNQNNRSRAGNVGRRR